MACKTEGDTNFESVSISLILSLISVQYMLIAQANLFIKYFGIYLYFLRYHFKINPGDFLKLKIYE